MSNQIAMSAASGNSRTNIGCSLLMKSLLAFASVHVWGSAVADISIHKLPELPAEHAKNLVLTPDGKALISRVSVPAAPNYSSASPDKYTTPSLLCSRQQTYNRLASAQVILPVTVCVSPEPDIAEKQIDTYVQPIRVPESGLTAQSFWMKNDAIEKLGGLLYCRVYYGPWLFSIEERGSCETDGGCSQAPAISTGTVPGVVNGPVFVWAGGWQEIPASLSGSVYGAAQREESLVCCKEMIKCGSDPSARCVRPEVGCGFTSQGPA